MTIEEAKTYYQKNARITFKILKESDKELIIGITQAQNAGKNYADKAKLEEIAREVYANTKKKILVNATPFSLNPTAVVTDKWIRDQMNEKDVRSKQLVADLGLSRSEISTIINGQKPFGIKTKGLFYYYFKSLGK